MHFIYVSGNLKPDHTGLSRFRQRHLARLPDLFVEIVGLARHKGLSQFRTICIDGTRLKADANPGKSLNGEELQRGLEKVRAQIAEYLKQCELADGPPPRRANCGANWPACAASPRSGASGC